MSSCSARLPNAATLAAKEQEHAEVLAAKDQAHADALAAQPDWPVIPMASAVEAGASARAPVGAAAPRSAAAKAFAELWRVVERHLVR